MSEIIFVSCPLCGLGRPLVKTGSRALARGIHNKDEKRGRVHFNHMDLDKAFIIQIRTTEIISPTQRRKSTERRGGRVAFRVTGGLTLEELKSNTEYEGLIKELKDQAKKIIQNIT